MGCSKTILRGKFIAKKGLPPEPVKILKIKKLTLYSKKEKKKRKKKENETQN